MLSPAVRRSATSGGAQMAAEPALTVTLPVMDPSGSWALADPAFTGNDSRSATAWARSMVESPALVVTLRLSRVAPDRSNRPEPALTLADRARRGAVGRVTSQRDF